MINDPQRRKSDAILKERPYLAGLRSKLLSIGGELVVDWYDLNDEAEVVVLLTFGMLWSTKSLKYRRGEPNHCHENSVRLAKQHPSRYRAIVGFTLCSDGVWIPHSWLYDMIDGRTTETTDLLGSHNNKYFGRPWGVRELEHAATQYGAANTLLLAEST